MNNDTSEDRRPGVTTTAAGTGQLDAAAMGSAKAAAAVEKEPSEHTVRAVRAALKGVGHVVWGFTRVSQYLETEIAKRLRDVPEDGMRDPSPRILYPAVQALACTAPDDPIRGLFASLLAADLQAAKKEFVHPAMVDMIKDMTTLEVQLLYQFKLTGPQILCEYRVYNDPADKDRFHSAASYYSIKVGDLPFGQIRLGLSNLERLGLISVEDKVPVSERLAKVTEQTEARAEIKAMRQTIENNKGMLRLHRRGIYLAPLGETFAAICL